MMRRPRIAITRQREAQTPGNPEAYLSVIRDAGGEPEYIGPDRNPDEVIRIYNGIVVPGGRDLSPEQYGESGQYPMAPEDPERSSYEFALLERARLEKKPVLGICYGMQLMNVFLGGGLFQDIALQTMSPLDHRKQDHPVIVDQNPFLTTGTYQVNSSHHQAVRKLGKGMVAFCHADDGIIEGIFDISSEFFMGVQWHPERLRNGLSRRIFSCLCEACHD